MVISQDLSLNKFHPHAANTLPVLRSGHVPRLLICTHVYILPPRTPSINTQLLNHQYLLKSYTVSQQEWELTQVQRWSCFILLCIVYEAPFLIRPSAKWAAHAFSLRPSWFIFIIWNDALTVCDIWSFRAAPSPSQLVHLWFRVLSSDFLRKVKRASY